MRALLRRIERRRRELQRKATRLGQQLFTAGAARLGRKAQRALEASSSRPASAARAAP